MAAEGWFTEASHNQVNLDLLIVDKAAWFRTRTAYIDCKHDLIRSVFFGRVVWK